MREATVATDAERLLGTPKPLMMGSRGLSGGLQDVIVADSGVVRLAGLKVGPLAGPGKVTPRSPVAIRDRELHQPVKEPQRLVVADVLLDLRRREVRQQEIGTAAGGGSLARELLWRTAVCAFGRQR